MSSRQLCWTRRAVRRLDQIGSYIAKDDPGAAARVVARIVSAVDNLASQPAMGRVGRIRGTREYVFADIPYIVAYRVRPDVVEIVTVFHGSQRWPLKLD
ncbi:type II toxin-antitoxin system RelE/ParE family toxin [Ensifer sp. LCM 4579]|uniref:type II toxin-antitoxin system RelE/ParE family toxin n=1 Tax=Ensifer sp. LCM 4579 TaxID=1848292 RepID=UPI0008D9981F|nr:type II toxin-antitoxin system RelE/ParE family toxin [Ensifer sp. LCM 4579]OHV83855.1 toxin Y4kP [Ensifer sp. LCM 4579]